MADETGMTNDKSVAAVTPDRPLPEEIGPYRVVAEIGRGGMGTVYRAHESSLNRDVAIKVLARHLTDDETVVARFTREARSTASLSHPNVVHIYSTGSENGQPYIAMEYVRGETLADLIRRENHLQPRRAVEILLQAASGLAAAHDMGIVHRDVKPANLMLDRAGHLKVTDFGIAQARETGEKLTTTGQFVGTSGYISPECCKGEPVDARSDIFALGVVLYEMLAGETPFNDDSPLGMLVQVVEAKVPDVRKLNPAVDDNLLRILHRMIEKSPDDRYQTCHELVRDLSAYLASDPQRTGVTTRTTAPPTAEMEQLPPDYGRRRRWPAVVALMLVLGIAGAGGYWAWNEYLAEPDALAARSGLEPDPVDRLPEPAIPAAGAQGSSRDTAAGGSTGTSGEPSDTDLPRGPVAAVGSEEPVDTDPGAGAGSGADGADEGLAAADGGEPAPATGSDPAAESSAEAGPATAGDPSTADSPAGEEVAALSPPRSEPVPAGPPQVLVVASGDPVIAGPIEEMLRESLDTARFRIMDKAFMPGLDRHVGAEHLDVAGLGELVSEQGGEVLIVARIVPVGYTPLYYYGRTSTLFTSRIELQGYDLVGRERLGEGWSNEVRYTELNATQQAEEALAPLADRLRMVLDDARLGNG